MDVATLLSLIKGGEGERVEFKRAVTPEVARDVCALSNTEGGHVLVGVSDEGDVIGVEGRSAEQRLSDVLQAVSPRPDATIDSVMVDDRKVLVVKVGASSSIHTVGSVAYVRLGRNNRRLSIGEIVEKAAESLMLFFDEQACHGATIDDISRAMVKEHLQKRSRLRGVKERGSIEENVLSLRAGVRRGGSVEPTNAGILFFCEDPQRHIGFSRVRLVWFVDEGMTTYKDRREFGGPIWRIADDVCGYLERNMAVVGGTLAGFRRQDFFEYPLAAVREAVINALVHRNYYDAAEVQILVFPRRMVVRNPGSFPPGVTPESPVHKPRNPILAQYMFDIGYVEKYGSGIRRIKEACEAHPLVDVSFVLEPYRTDVVFSKRGDAVTALTDTGQRVLAFIKDRGGATSSEVARHIGKSKQAALQHVQELVARGLVVRRGKGRSTLYVPAESSSRT